MTQQVLWSQTPIKMGGIHLLIGWYGDNEPTWMAPLGTQPPTIIPPPYSSGWSPAGHVCRVMSEHSIPLPPEGAP